MANTKGYCLVSIIVPIYKVEQYLIKCLNSIINQTYQNLEIILIDDGSPDNCGHICDNYAKKDSRIVVVHQENSGLSAARNTGLEVCSGDFIAFVDSDDWVEPDFIEAMLEIVDYNTLACCGVFLHKNDTVTIIKPMETRKYNNQVLAYLQNKANGHTTIASWVWCKLYPKQIFENLRFPIGHNYEDIFLLVDILKSVDKVIVLNSALYHYNIREGSITHTLSERNVRDHISAYNNLELKLKNEVIYLEYLKKIRLSVILSYMSKVNNNKKIFSDTLVVELHEDSKHSYECIKNKGIKLRIQYYCSLFIPQLYPFLVKVWLKLKTIRDFLYNKE